MSKVNRRDVPPPGTGPAEREVLVGYLEYLRQSVVRNVEGVPEPEVRTPGVDSGTNLLGLLRHLGFVERFRFLGEEPGSWPATLRARKADTVDSVLADYRDTVARTNAVLEGWDDLGAPAPRAPGRPAGPNRRWAILAVVNETSRHAGHMDILRERIDGATGR